MRRMTIFIVLALALGGCATAERQQQTAQPVSFDRTAVSPGQAAYSSTDYYDVDTWPADSYEKETPKTSSRQAIQLSPRQIQRALKNAGYYKGAVDGKIGPKTRDAVLKFQRSQGLKADGIVGKNTSAQLRKYLDK